MSIDQLARDLMPFIVVFVGLVAWHIRGEAKGLANEKALIELQKLVDKLESQLRALDSKIFDKLSYIERSLAKIEGKLSVDSEQQHS